MRILYIYRHNQMGFSIGKVFRAIEKRMNIFCDVTALYMPNPNYWPNSLKANVHYVWKHLKDHTYDIIHITGTEHYLIPFIKSTPSKIIVTVHDFGFYANQTSLPSLCWKYLFWVKTLKGADRVTFVSTKSRIEAEKLITFHKGQVRVIPNPVGVEFTYVRKVLNLARPVILQIGTSPHKNLNNTLVALRDFPCKLRIIGKLDDAQRTLLSIYHMDYSNACHLSDKEIQQEYAQCDIVNFPSFYEGFGLPVIEGQATGRVVVTSALSPMKDIAGDSAVLVNPADVDSIRAGYQRALANAEHYVKAGLKNVSRYHIDKIVSEYLNLYKELCPSE